MILVNGAALMAYRDVLPPRLEQWLPQFISATLCFQVDIPTMAAIIDRESLGGDALKPKGPGGYGDGGHGHGLGQIDDRSHGGFLHARFWDGARLWQDPTFNILFAARLLRANLSATGGDMPLSIAAYNCGLKRARWELEQHKGDITDEESRIAVLDSVTANGDYVTDCLRRRREFTPPEAALNA
jgi:hypothetical protein